jgi:hypothetical protein
MLPVFSRGTSWCVAAACGAAIQIFVTVDPVLADDDPLLPRLECVSPPPKGVKRFSFPTHTEVLGGEAIGVEAYDGLKTSILRQRFALIKDTNCHIVFYTWYFRNREVSLAATGKFEDMFADPLAKPRSLLEVVLVSQEVLEELSPAYLECKDKFQGIIRNVQPVSSKRTLEEIASLDLAHTEMEACRTVSIAELDARGFVGLWSSGIRGSSNAFAFIDGKLSMWSE